MTQPFDVFYADLLDSLGIAVCIFDRDDRVIHWNTTFLKFFPEHDGHIHLGELYADNLRRFYTSRATLSEQAPMDRYIQEGVVRHRQQSRPFFFSHLGRKLQVASLATETGDRVRMWQELANDEPAGERPTAALAIDTLEYIPDGVMVINAEDGIIAANREFRRLYDIPVDVSVVGERMSRIVSRIWEASGVSGSDWQLTVMNNLRYTGAPFEIMLPDERWRRVIARQTADGTRYVTHSDITAMKRQYRELKDAEERARASEQALQQAHDALAAMAATDGLTHLANRRHFEERLQHEWKRAGRDSSPISLLMIDIDHFKSINDRFGHIIGDDCLRRVAEIISDAARRPADIVARYGGEEFAILLPTTGLSGALQIAEAIQAKVALEDWRSITPALTSVTLSIGVHTGENAVGKTKMQDLLQKADALLYRAKHSGRNRIESSSYSLLPRGD